VKVLDAVKKQCGEMEQSSAEMCLNVCGDFPSLGEKTGALTKQIFQDMFERRL